MSAAGIVQCELGPQCFVESSDPSLYEKRDHLAGNGASQGGLAWGAEALKKSPGVQMTPMIRSIHMKTASMPPVYTQKCLAVPGTGDDGAKDPALYLIATGATRGWYKTY